MCTRSSPARRARKFPCKSEVKSSRLPWASSTKRAGSPPQRYPQNGQKTVINAQFTLFVRSVTGKVSSSVCSTNLTSSFLSLFRLMPNHMMKIKSQKPQTLVSIYDSDVTPFFRIYLLIFRVMVRVRIRVSSGLE